MQGITYILDEPSIGLHQRDNQRLITALKQLRDIGNTVLVVEHDKDIMMASDYLVDIATLTGSATLGLGRQYGAMYTRDLKVAKTLNEIGERIGERVWHMPLIDDYRIALESDVADFNHTADKESFSAGSVTAALFLEHFAGETGRNARWIHLDIAGVARSEGDSGENPKGGTGFGVRLLSEWIANLS